MTKITSNSLLYNVQRIILLIFYSFTMVTLFIPLARWVHGLSPENVFPLVFTFIAYIVIVVVLGSFIYFISYIPFNLATAFDPIKNDIASGKIIDKESFGIRITAFITDFFNFSFLDIDCAIFQSGGTGLITNSKDPALAEAIREHDILQPAQKEKGIMYLGRISVGDRYYHLYLLPVWFGERWLGSIGLISRKRIGKFSRKIIEEFENNFLYDQLMHVMNRNQKETL